MKFLLALALLGAAAAYSISSSKSPDHDKQFRSKFVSQILTGIPEIDSQYAGFYLTGDCVSQYLSNYGIHEAAKFQLQKLKFMNFNGKLEFDSKGEWDISSPFVTDVPEEWKKYLETPFESLNFHKTLKTESEEPVMITNIKKAIISSFVSYHWMTGSKMTDDNLIRKQQYRSSEVEYTPYSSFKTMEKTFLGECEVEYTVNKLAEYQINEFESTESNPGAAEFCSGKNYYEVISSVNYENCVERPIYQRTVGGSSHSDGTQGYSSPLMKESYTKRSILCGHDISTSLTRKQDSAQTVLVSGNGKFESEEKIKASCKVSFELYAVEPKTTFPELQSPVTCSDLSFNYPAGDFWTTTKSAKSLTTEQSSSGVSSYDLHLPLPDMTSAPISPYPILSSEEEAKNKFVEEFVKMIEDSRKSTESRSSHEDVVNQASHLAWFVSSLSYEDINDCWTKAQTKLVSSISYKQSALNIFCDVLSMTATNPSVKFVIEKLKSKQLQGESGAWIVANMIRSIRTPTEEVIEELTELLKHESIQEDRILSATVAMTLTELVHKACVDETTSQFNFPTKVYGQFCYGESKPIRKNLVPFLQKQLYDLKDELSNEKISFHSTHKLITLINALGNIGTEETSKTLLQVIEGVLTMESHPRSVAVYKLIRAASRNPAKYRPIILSLIHNTAENEEVRMAAISALPYCQPSSTHLKKLSLLTWFDSSKQVASYISSTLKSLMESPLGSTESKTGLSQMAEEAYKFAKPYLYGIEKSHNIKITQFLDTLKSSVGLNLQYVNSEESAIPKNMYLKSEIKSKVQSIKQLETSVYVQGVDQIIEKIQDLYKFMIQKQQPMEKEEEKLDYLVRKTKTPEAHITLKMFDMQRLFTIDYEFMQELVAELSHEMSEQSESNGIKRDYLKVIDLTNDLVIVPSISGLPIYIKHITPLVIKSHTSVMVGRHQVIEVKSTPVINYMKKTEVGTICPFTKHYLGTGVESQIHMSMPLRADVSYNSGSLSVNLKTPGDEESQQESTVFEHKIIPFTIKNQVFDLSDIKQQQTIIKSESQYKSDYHLGKLIGVDMNLKVETDREYYDLTSLMEEVSVHKPLTFLSLPLPLKSCKYHNVKLNYNPASSQTKEATFVFSLGHASKYSHEKSVEYSPKFDEEAEYESECRSEVSQGKWVSSQAEISEHEHDEIFTKKSQKNYQQSEQQQLKRKEEKSYSKCVMEKICMKRKYECESELRSENRPTEEVVRHCSVRLEDCRQRHSSRSQNKKILHRLRSGYATTFTSSLILTAEHGHNKKLETHITVAHSTENSKMHQTEVDIKVTYLPTTSSSKAYSVTLRSSNKMEKPTSYWNKHSILSQGLKGKLDIQTCFGYEDEQKEVLYLTINSSQSEDQKKYVTESYESKKCEKHTAQGLKLTEECKKVTAAAGSLDKFETVVYVPSFISQNKYLESVAVLAKTIFSPFIKFESNKKSQYKSQEYEGLEKYIFTFKVHPLGKKLSLYVKSKESEFSIENIRVPMELQGLLPLNVINSHTTNIMQKLTSQQAPSTCSLEKGLVKTFDNVKYEYSLNDCEHIIFKDCSQSSRVEVSVQQLSSAKKVKVSIDNHKYELEIPSQVSEVAKIKVNNEEKSYIKKSEHKYRQQQQEMIEIEKQMTEFVEEEHNYYSDKNTYVTSYEDGVYSIVSKLYGFSVYVDQESIEVKTYQHILRNRACGLCGDLNDESTADVKSAHACVMSSPKLSAFTYMIQDSSCQGVPAHYQQQLSQETEKCVKKVTVPTQVTKLYTQKLSFSKKHLSEEKDNKICFSKQQVTVCPSYKSPQQIHTKKVQYFCVSKDSYGEKMLKMAEQGDKLNYAAFYPTEYERSVSVPTMC